jgi:hypothetical protein
MSEHVHPQVNPDGTILVQDPPHGHPLSVSLEITTDDPITRDNQLSKAVDQLIPAALERRHGILVTQRSWGRYIIQVDPGVPCGNIHEKRC